MKRGDLITVALSGDFGKPRPALVIQSDDFQHSESVIVVLVTSTLIDAPLARVDVAPDSDNGLKKPSQIMADKIMTIRRDKTGAVIGRVSDDVMVEVTRSMALILGFG